MVNKRPRGLTAIAEFSFLDVIPIDNLSAPTSTEVGKITLGEIVDNIAGDVGVTSGGVSSIGASKVTNAMLAGSIDPSKITGVAAVQTDNLSVFAATSSLQLKGVISDETGSGLLVFGTSPTLITPALGTPSSGVMTNMTGLLDAGVAAGAAIATTKLADSANFILGDQNNDFNAFFQDLDGIAVPANPAAGHRRVFVDSADGILKVRTPGGTTVSLEGAGGGEANTASNVGTGVGVFDVKNGVDLEFNSLIGGTGIDISDTVQDLTIAIDSTVAVHSENLSVFAATTSLQLLGVISDETGSGLLVFGTSPTLITPALGTPASGVMTNVTGTSGITGLGTLTQDINMGGQNIDEGGVIFLIEQAEADADVAGRGQIWVDLATPNKLFFTDDAGTDHDLTALGTQTPWAQDIDADGFNLTDGGVIFLREQAEADADVAGQGQIWVDTQTPNKLFFTDDAGTDFDLTAGGGATDTEYPIRLALEVPEGTVAFPDVHALATAGAKADGFVLPDGASTSTINLKTEHPIPDSLAGTPAARIEFIIMTKGAVAGPKDVRLTVSSLAVADTENFDQAFTAETETTVTMPTATETQDVYSQDMTTDPVAGDTVLIQIKRDPTDAADDFTDDIQIVAATLWIKRST